jgi:hypothetical protein
MPALRAERLNPLFFVSVAAKGVSFAVSLLFATLAGGFMSVADKGFMGTAHWRESNGLGWQVLKELDRGSLER